MVTNLQLLFFFMIKPNKKPSTRALSTDAVKKNKLTLWWDIRPCQMDLKIDTIHPHLTLFPSIWAFQIQSENYALNSGTKAGGCGCQNGTNSSTIGLKILIMF